MVPAPVSGSGVRALPWEILPPGFVFDRSIRWMKWIHSVYIGEFAAALSTFRDPSGVLVIMEDCFELGSRSVAALISESGWP